MNKYLFSLFALTVAAATADAQCPGPDCPTGRFPLVGTPVRNVTKNVWEARPGLLFKKAAPATTTVTAAATAKVQAPVPLTPNVKPAAVGGFGVTVAGQAIGVSPATKTVTLPPDWTVAGRVAAPAPQAAAKVPVGKPGDRLIARVQGEIDKLTAEIERDKAAGKAIDPDKLARLMQLIELILKIIAAFG